MPISTISGYKAYAGITGTSEDSLLTTLLNMAQSAMERYCGRSFDQATLTEIVNGTGGPTIRAPRFPVTTLTSVEVRTGESAWTVVASSGYRLDGAAGLIWSLDYTDARVPVESTWDDVSVSYSTVAGSGGWPKGFQNIRLSYVGGFATAPDDLVWALYRVIDRMYAERRRDPNIKGESIGAYSVQYSTPTEAVEAERELLQPYRVGVL